MPAHVPRLVARQGRERPVILVDYRCPRCGGLTERLVASPPPKRLPCPACRTPANRQFSPVGLLRCADPPRQAPAAPTQRPACSEYPDVPALCHMEPSAARAWVARARGDNQALDRESERQEKVLRERPEQVQDPVHHDHSHPPAPIQGQPPGASAAGPAVPA